LPSSMERSSIPIPPSRLPYKAHSRARFEYGQAPIYKAAMVDRPSSGHVVSGRLSRMGLRHRQCCRTAMR
jgi:hypothetical protein